MDIIEYGKTGQTDAKDLVYDAPEELLWAEVVERAYGDVLGRCPGLTLTSAASAQREAWEWIDSEDFDWTMNTAGYDVDFMRAAFKQARAKAQPQIKVLAQKSGVSKPVYMKIPKQFAEVGMKPMGYQIIEVPNEGDET